MICSQCKATNSPADAHFCVSCGYAMRQACPYECGTIDLPVRADNPSAQCPKCQRFTAYCPSCLRLHSLGARVCQTPRCARAGVQPCEPFVGHSGRAGGAPVALQMPWHNGGSALLEPRAQSPNADQRCGGLAARYGQIVWWKGEKLHLWAAPKPDGFWPVGKPQTIEAIAPLFRGGIFPAREALLLAHGQAYLLGQNAVVRVPLGQANATRQLLTLRDGAHNATAITDGGAAGSWQPHQIEWMAQNETADKWFGLGSVGETLVGVTVRGSSALFEGERWELPPDVDLKDWLELLAWNNAPLLRCERVLWQQINGVWSRVFELEASEDSLDGALVCGPYLWVWGQEKGRLWVERLSADETRVAGSRLRPSMPYAPNDSLSASPVCNGARITFFVEGSQCGAATLNVARPLDEAHVQQLPAATEVLWTAAVSHGDSQWLVYALDDGELVRFETFQQTPLPTQPVLLQRFRPFRDEYLKSKGATLAATIGGDCLVVCYVGHKGAESGVLLMAYAWR